MVKILICLLTLLLSACMTRPVQIEKYAGQQPALKIQDFFRGHLRGYGVLTDKDTRLANHLLTDIDAHWAGNDGLLKQSFQFANGEKKYREWCMHVIDEHHFSVVASFYEGTVAGEQYGNVMHMIYHIKLPSKQNYYNNLHKPGDIFQALNNSPEHMLYTLLTSGNVISDVKAVEGLEKNTMAVLKMPRHVEIGAFCARKNNEWRVERAADASYVTFELDNWFFRISKNVVMQESAVKEHGKKLGELDVALVR